MTQKTSFPQVLAAAVIGAALLLATIASADECLEDDLVEDCNLEVCIGQVFVEMNPGFPIDFVLDQFPELFEIEAIHQLRFHLLGLEIPLGQPIEETVEAMVSQIEALGENVVERVEPHRNLDTPEGVQLSIPDLGVQAEPEDFEQQPASSTVGTAAAHQRFTGAGITVAVIDTGMAFSHPLTTAQIAQPGADFAGGDGTGQVQPNGQNDDNDADTDESLHHATFVAGLVHLVAPGARILPIRALETDGKGTTFGVAKAIYYAIEYGADVINLSHGMLYEARPVDKAIEDAVDRGIVVVVAAGNRGEPIVDESLDDVEEACMSFPASHPEVIAVAAVDENLVKAPFSDYGQDVDLSAPGVDLLSTFGELATAVPPGFASWSGTSFAAPLVSGAAALILDKYPCLAPAEVRLLLMQTAQPDNNPGLVGQMGAGVLDLDALTLALTTDRCSLELEQTTLGTLATWSPVQGAASYDLVSGDVSNLAVMPTPEGNRVDLGPLTCIVEDTVMTDSTAAPDAFIPAPGEAVFYLFRDDLDPYFGADSRGNLRQPGVGDCAGGP